MKWLWIALGVIGVGAVTFGVVKIVQEKQEDDAFMKKLEEEFERKMKSGDKLEAKDIYKLVEGNNAQNETKENNEDEELDLDNPIDLSLPFDQEKESSHPKQTNGKKKRR